MGGMGGGDENLSGGCLSEKNFVVGIIDRTGMQTESSRITWEGKVHFRGKYGEATVNVPFAKISQVDFRPANTEPRLYGCNIDSKFRAAIGSVFRKSVKRICRNPFVNWKSV